MAGPFAPEQILPDYCPENIVIFVDSSSDVSFSKLELNDREPVDSFTRLQKIIRMFLSNKELANNDEEEENDEEDESSKGKFAVMTILGGSPSMITGDGRFGDVNAAITHLQQIRMKEPEQGGNNKSATGDAPSTPMNESTLDIGEVILAVNQDSFVFNHQTAAEAGIGERPKLYTTRLIMFLTTSRSQIKLEMTAELTEILNNPYFCVDILYLHEEIGDENLAQLNWSIMEQLNPLQSDRGYLLESGPDLTDWHNSAALLLAPPIFRIPLDEMQYGKRKTRPMNGSTASDVMADDDVENEVQIE